VTTLNLAPVVLTMGGPPLRDGGVAVEGDRVIAIGTRPELLSAYDGARLRSWDGVLMPGLVNAHAHLQYTDFGDLAELGRSEGFVTWLRTLTARRRTWDDSQWRESARRGIHAMLATGTTCVADIVTDPAVLAPTARSGLAGISYVEVVGADAERWPAARERLLHALDSAPRGRTVGVSPHALYSLGAEVIRGAAEIARDRGLRLHPHIAESLDEDRFVRAGEGLFADLNRANGLAVELTDGGAGESPVAHLARLGLIAADVHVAHGVHVTAADRALLRDSGTTVALCPRSNALLGNGEPPVAAYLAEGNPIAVGTDSLASSPSLDLMADVSRLHALALAQGASAAGLAEAVVRAATVGGADAMGLADAGRITVGGRADLAVFDVPTDGDPYEELVQFGEGHCTATVLAGRLVHRAGVSA
jgi:cytosine/adenosine deaminase-related metal-dependent hydrolase